MNQLAYLAQEALRQERLEQAAQARLLARGARTGAVEHVRRRLVLVRRPVVAAAH